MILLYRRVYISVMNIWISIVFIRYIHIIYNISHTFNNLLYFVVSCRWSWRSTWHLHCRLLAEIVETNAADVDTVHHDAALLKHRKTFSTSFVFCLLVAYCCIMSANLVPAPDSPFNFLLRLCQVLARRLPRLRQSKKCFLQLRGHGPSQLMEKITNKMAPLVE